MSTHVHQKLRRSQNTIEYFLLATVSSLAFVVVSGCQQNAQQATTKTNQPAAAAPKAVPQDWASEYEDILQREPLAKNELPLHSLRRHSLHFSTSAERQLLRNIRDQPREVRLASLKALIVQASLPDADYLPIEYFAHAAVGADAALRRQVIEQIVLPGISTDTKVKATQAQDLHLRLGLALHAEQHSSQFCLMAWDRMTDIKGDDGVPRQLDLVVVSRLIAVYENAHATSLIDFYFADATHQQLINFSPGGYAAFAEAIESLNAEQFKSRADAIAGMGPITSTMEKKLLEHMTPEELRERARAGSVARTAESYNGIVESIREKLADPFLPVDQLIETSQSLSAHVVSSLPKETRESVRRRLWAATRSRTSGAQRNLLTDGLTRLVNDMDDSELKRMIELTSRQIEVPGGRVKLWRLEGVGRTLDPSRTADFVRQLLSLRESDSELAPALTSAIASVGARVPTSDAPVLMKELNAAEQPNSDALLPSMIALAKALEEDQRSQFHDLLLQRLRETKTIEDATKQISWLADADLDSSRARQTLDVAIDVLSPEPSRVGERRLPPNFTVNVLRKLTARLSADDRAKVTDAVESTLDSDDPLPKQSYFASWLAGSSDYFNREEAARLRAALMHATEENLGTHILAFCSKRPAEEAVETLRSIVPQMLRGEFPLSRRFRSLSSFVMTLVSKLSVEEADEILQLVDPNSTNTSSAGQINTQVFQAVAPNASLEAQRSMATKILADQEFIASNPEMAVSNLSKISDALSREQRRAAVDVAVGRVESLMNDQAGRRTSSMAAQHIQRSTLPPFQELVARLEADDCDEVSRRIASLIAKIEKRSSAIPGLVALLAAIPGDVPPDLLTQIITSVRRVHYPAQASEVIRLLSPLRGTVAAGGGEQLWKVQSTEARPQVTGLQFDVRIAVARYVHDDDASTYANRCLDLIFKQVITKSAPPHSIKTFAKTPTAQGLRYLMRRLQPTDAEAMFDRILKAAGRTRERREAVTPLLASLLEALPSQDVDSFWKRFDEIKSVLDVPTQWRLYGVAMKECSVVDRHRTVVAACRRSKFSMERYERHLANLRRGKSDTGMLWVQVFNQWPNDVVVDFVQVAAERSHASAEERVKFAVFAAAVMPRRLTEPEMHDFDFEAALRAPDCVGVTRLRLSLFQAKVRQARPRSTLRR